MKKYEILEHKADLKIRAFGKTKEELFLNMLKAMSEVQKPEIKKEESIIKEIKVKSLDLPALLVDFLSEALYLGQTDKETYIDVKFKKFSDNELEGKILGYGVESFGEDIKAVTYHELDIHQQDSGRWEAIVLFDI